MRTLRTIHGCSPHTRLDAPLAQARGRTPPRARRGPRAAAPAGRRSSSCATSPRSIPAATSALERVSLGVDRGEFVFLVGPTGCGKSTLIKLLIRELEPADGEVLIAGRDINELDRKTASRTCAAASAPSSRTSSCCRTGPSTTTSPTRSR